MKKSLADELNEHLEDGGAVQLTTYLRSTLYTSKHAGWFSTGDDGATYVRSGRRKDCIAQANGTVLVGIKKGRFA